ncbi:MAG: DUF1801 domain-containing protein [Candidatus Binatia bacterium]
MPEPRRKIVSVIHKAIRAALPKLMPDILHVMLGYGPFHYKHASGHEGDWFVVGLASQKNYVSRYICACDKNGYLAEKNKSRLGEVPVGRSCIRFKKLEDLNLKVAMGLVKKAAALVRKLGGFSLGGFTMSRLPEKPIRK